MTDIKPAIKDRNDIKLKDLLCNILVIGIRFFRLEHLHGPEQRHQIILPTLVMEWVYPGGISKTR